MVKKNASTITRLPVAASNKTLVQPTSMAAKVGAKRSAFADVGNVNVKVSFTKIYG